ncbi:3-dehydroquinate synthase [Thermosulfurimonas sp. F29]|uniref:3-dehydroquinate synthase n=1 Tax=Thermosulfurimonas sp. F29 TaxID=2867247 RepID=UPI001C82D67F|nr:3-dehydroquinate synthase [Thermosulfurimonas sp. F29]MBX6424054.1 3-dehydroquinate synthase [Thermosulfurimonas sp. F29]
MRVLQVKTAPPYEILIGGGILADLPEDLPRVLETRRLALITDDTVRDFVAEDLSRLLSEGGFGTEVFSFSPGETSKRMETVVDLARRMIRAGFDRKCAVMAVGGGVVGDVAGFLASIYLRGIPYVQVPTTLLAQVDSSVGGKTGVDLPEGKNLLGTFYQPRRVYIDYGVLSTLPREHFRNGLAEVVKYGCIASRSLFEYLEKNISRLFLYDPEILEEIIYESCRIKAEVVSRDERESGLRRVLNFGHTLGHALEAALNYKILHGEAVAVGMVAAARLSETLGVAREAVSERLEALLTILGLPVRLPRGISPDNLLVFLSADKKVWHGKLTMVLLKSLGEFVFYENPPVEALEKVLRELLPEDD